VGDILALQTDVARSVASELKANLQNLADVPAKGVNAEAYDLYLRGQHELRMREFGEAVRYLERAIAIDSGFIPAYHSLGLAYREEVVEVRVPMAENRAKLREMVSRGLRVAPDDPGLLALSALLARYDGDIKLAEQRFATAQQKDPSNRIVQRVYASFKLDQGYPDEALALTRRIREIDPLNSNLYVHAWSCYMDLGNAKEAMAAAERYREIVTRTVPTADKLIAVTRSVLLGDLAGSIEYGNRFAAQIEPPREGAPPWLPLLYYAIGDLQTADSLMDRGQWVLRSAYEIVPVEAYRHLVYGEIEEARRLAVATLTAPKKIWGGDPGDVILLRLAVDAMLESGEAQRAVDFLEKLAPEYARYKASKDIDPRDFAPAPVPVKSAFSSYPALYFTDYTRALRAVGDEAGANQMLDHLEAILELRRQRGLFIEERYAAEALALRGKTEAALDALEKAERDRTIYDCWNLCLLHNEIFAGFRNHPRFVALVEKIRRDLSRQREQLESAKN
jgi:tetratricopeptide (TPR) repeat protein